MLTLVLGPLLDRVVWVRDDVVVLLDGMARGRPRPGGRPRGRPLWFVVSGCVDHWFGLRWTISSSSSVPDFGLISIGPIGSSNRGPNKGKLLRVSVRDGLDSSGAEVPEGDGIRFVGAAG